MILSDKSQVASKEYRCHDCDGKILKGEKYHRRFGGYDKTELHERILCADCYEQMTYIERHIILMFMKSKLKTSSCSLM